MTREEAIKRLAMGFPGSIEEGKKYVQAVDMAISALSTEGEYIKKSELLQHVTTEELSDFKDCDVIHAEEIDELTTYSFPDSAENKGDLISRQAVLDELEKWDWQELYLPIHFKQILNDVPSVENKGFDGMTNGEVIQAIFPNASIYKHGSTYSVNNEYNFNSTWWNAPYKAESEVKDGRN